MWLPILTAIEREGSRLKAYALALTAVTAAWGTDIVRSVYAAVQHRQLVFEPDPLYQIPATLTATFMSVVVAWSVCGSHGLQIDADGRNKWTLDESIKTFGIAVLAMGVGSAASKGLTTYAGFAVPVSNVEQSVPGLLTAGLHEEPIMVAVVFIFVAAFGLPTWEAILFVIVVRSAFHAYLGLAVVPNIAIWATTFVLLWMRYRNLPALVAAHTFINAAVAFIPR